MTKELQTIQRQAIVENISLGQGNPYGNIQNQFNKLSSFGTGMAAQIAVPGAQQKGKQLAVDKQGEPQKLAPGLTAATRAYNNAYNDVTVNLLGVKGDELVKTNLRNELASPKFGDGSIARFKQINDGTIEGILSQTPDNLKADVAIKLMSATERAGGILADKVSQKNIADMNSKFEYLLSNNLREMKESTLGGDIEGVKFYKNSIEELIQSRKDLGLLNDNEEASMLKSLNDAMMSSEYTARYLESRINGTEERLLEDLGQKKPEDLTFEQWDQVRSQILGIKRQQDALVNSQEALNLSNWQQKILTGQVSSLSDLEPAKGDMSALNYVNLQNKFLASQASASKMQANIMEFSSQLTTNPSKAARASADVKNAFYDQVVEAETQRRREQTGNPNYEMSLAEKAQLMAPATVPIPALNDELNYGLLSGDVANASEVLRAYAELNGNPDTLSDKSKALNLDSKAEQVAHSAMLQARYGNASFEQALTDAREGILNVSSELRQSRLAEFDQKFSKNRVKTMASTFKEITGKNASDNQFAAKVMEDLLRHNAGSMRSLSEAESLTKQQMNASFKTSKFGENSDRLMYSPPEDVLPFADTGKWLDNQYTYAVKQVADNFKKAEELKQFLPQMTGRMMEVSDELRGLSKTEAPDQARVQALQAEGLKLQRDIRAAQFVPSSKITWGHDFDLPSNPSEAELMSSNLLRKGEISRRSEAALGDKRTGGEILSFASSTKPQLKINGKKRDIFIESDSSTMSRENGKPTWGLYYKDDMGYTQPVENPFDERGQAQFAALQFDEFLVNQAKELSDLSINQVSEAEANAIFERDNPKRPFLDSFSGFHVLQREGAKRQFAEKEGPVIAEKLQAKRAELEKNRGR